MARAFSGIMIAVTLAVLWTAAVHGDDSAGELFEKGKGRLNAGEYQEAAGLFSKAFEVVDKSRRDAWVIMMARAQANYGAKDLKNAVNDLNAVLKSNAADAETIVSALMLRGTINMGRDSLHEALEDLTRAIKIRHDDISLRATSFANRGIIYINMGDLESAMSDLNQAISLDPESGFAYAGRALANLRRDKIQQAERDSLKALSLKRDRNAEKIARRVLNELAAPVREARSVTLPINDHGQIFVQVRFSDNGAPHRFLLDTGATHSLVDYDLLQEIKNETTIKEIGRGTVALADGSKHQVTRYRVKNVFLYHLPLGEIELHAFQKKTEGILNLLGLGSLNTVSLSIDGIGKKVKISHKDDAR